MLDKKDIQFLEKMFAKVTENMVTKDMLRDALHENNEIFGHQLRREMRDEIHAVVNGAVFASEKRLTKLIMDTKEEILDGVADIIGNEIIPQIDDLEVRTLRLEHRVA